MCIRDSYKEYVKVQQIKNELDIQEQFISRQKDLQDRKDELSSKFFQTGYVSNQKPKNEQLIRELIHNKFGSHESLSSRKSKGNTEMDLHYLRGHLEVLIDEIDLFLDQAKESEENEVEIRTFVNNLFSGTDTSIKANNIVLHFGKSLPQRIKVNKNVLNQILSLMCERDMDGNIMLESKLVVDNIQDENPTPVSYTHLTLPTICSV